MLNDQNFLVNEETIDFIAWDPQLEKTILKNCFKNINILNQLKSKCNFSLSLVTKNKTKTKQYFSIFKEKIKEVCKPEEIQKRNLWKDGELASLAGYQIYIKYKRIRNPNIKININLEKIIEEVKEYSYSDVENMLFLEKNNDFFLKKIKKLEIKKDKYKKLKTKEKDFNNILKFLNKYENKKETVEQVITKITEENTIIKSEKDILDKQIIERQIK